MGNTGCPESSHVVGWVPVLLLPQKAAVSFELWEACKCLVWAARAEACIKHEPTQALFQAVPHCCTQSQTAAWFFYCFLSPSANILRQMEKIVTCDRTRVCKYSFPLPLDPTLFWEEIPKVTLGCMWESSPKSSAGNTHPAKVCTVQVTAKFYWSKMCLRSQLTPG